MADIGYGAKFQRGTGTPLVYSNLGEMTDLGMPEVTRDTRDATHYESPGAMREYIAGMGDAGQASVTIQFDSPSELATIHADFVAATLKPYRVVFPDAATWDFEALVTSVGTAIPMDDRMTATVQFKLSGQPDFILP